MRTESLRRVYCDACGLPEEIWLPFDPSDILPVLIEHGFVVQVPDGFGLRHYNIGRVTCPACAEEA